MEQQTAKPSASEDFFGNKQSPVKYSNLIFQNMSDGIVLLNNAGNITYMNAAAKSILDVSEEETIAGVSFIEKFSHRKKNKAFNRFTQKCIQNNYADKKNDIKYITADKKNRFLDISISLIQAKPDVKGLNGNNFKHPTNDYNNSNILSNNNADIQGMLLLLQDTSYRHRLKQHEHDCAYIFAGLIFCITFYLTLWRYLNFTRHIYLHRDTYTLIIEIITFILFLEIVFMTSFSLNEIGLIPKWKNLKRNCLETFATGIVTCLIILLTKVVLTLIGYKIKGYFIGGSFDGACKYIFTSFVQEFLARGVIQTSVKYLMHVKYQTAFSIILTSLLFSLMHMPFGFYFMFGAFILSLALGYLYEHQQSIWGCVFLHWACGYLAMCLFF